jgi:acyl-CoA synthetase (AMP-forming)/AMP-acid ligase II
VTGSGVERAIFGRLVEARAEQEPDRLAFVFENGSLPDEQVRYRDIALNANKLAAELRASGLRKQDRAAIMLRNHPEFVYGLAAHSKLGLVNVSIDPRTRSDKLRYFLSFAECSSLITADYVVCDELVAAAIRSSGVRCYVLSTAEGRAQGLSSEGWHSLNDVFARGEQPDVGQHVTEVTEPWLLAFTSGTTGDPKGILFGYERMLFFQHLPTFLAYTEDDVLYTGLSLTHGNALVVTMTPPLFGSVRHSVFSRWFTKSRLWDVCIEYDCTSWSNLGGIATAIYSEPASAKDRAHRVRLVVSAGMPRELWRPFEQRFGVDVLEWYGTTEGTAFAYNPVGVGPIGSFGKPPDGFIEIDVVDDAGRSVAPGVAGEMISRPVGGEARLEYYKNPEASKNKIRNGWLYTGDIVTRDQDGWLYYAYRKEEGALRKMGEFIAEGFIRRVLAEDPDVVDVHIYGLPARDGAPGESEIVAAIAVRSQDDFDPQRLFERCARRLERSHVPDHIQMVAEIEKTSSGKVQSRLLAQRFHDDPDSVFSRPSLIAHRQTSAEPS